MEEKRSPMDIIEEIDAWAGLYENEWLKEGVKRIKW